jgi:hypothetical protein
MRLRALTVIWLECALHGNDSLRPVKVEGRQRFGAEMAPKHRWYGPAKAGVNAAGGTMRRRDLARRTSRLAPRIRPRSRRPIPTSLSPLSRGTKGAIPLPIWLPWTGMLRPDRARPTMLGHRRLSHARCGHDRRPMGPARTRPRDPSGKRGCADQALPMAREKRSGAAPAECQPAPRVSARGKESARCHPRSGAHAPSSDGSRAAELAAAEPSFRSARSGGSRGGSGQRQQTGRSDRRQPGGQRWPAVPGTRLRLGPVAAARRPDGRSAGAGGGRASGRRGAGGGGPPSEGLLLGDNDGDELLTGRGQGATAMWRRLIWGRRDWLSPGGS